MDQMGVGRGKDSRMTAGFWLEQLGGHLGRPGRLVEERVPAGNEFPYWPC